ncbi:LOW QUALITY PROTEIN: hypothetical protein CVT25_011355 [Psilocybe cyanescens]|uniref:Cytochrome P450 n=1 Tax=Psilocybe cyanescens TaxID=93625 RepID=A0A409WG60_PSICY|nr:LOW QUALITY PROTEIN: hypothetical protein CVT25_011355 [Psilocybe cyanescens]
MYGYDIKSIHDPVIETAEAATILGGRLMAPGGSLINIFPLLRHIPIWFPGATSRKEAEEVRRLTEEVVRIPTDFVKKSLADGTAVPSLVTDFYEKKYAGGASETEEFMIKNVAYTVYGGEQVWLISSKSKTLNLFSLQAASDTTISASGTFFHQMVLNPDIQRKAQAELDRVVGSKRLPTLADRKSLPYVEAIYREVLRFKPPIPIGVPHSLITDDHYKGYYIPQGTTVFTNIWAMTHNEDVYPEPFAFKPERFFDANGKLNNDDRILAYGFGRRICVGKAVASSSLWLQIAPPFVNANSILSLTGAVLLIFWAFFRQRLTQQNLPYPPGPPSRSLLFGNVADIPKTKQWIGYMQWREQYGDIIHFRVLQQHMIILNSLEVAKDLLEKRSNIYSDRPNLTMIDIMDWEFNTGLKHYGAQWRADRRVFQDLFNPSALLSYRPIQTEKIRDMLHCLLKNPEDFVNHYKTFYLQSLRPPPFKSLSFRVNAAIILRLVYGYDISPYNDYFVRLAESAVQKLAGSVFLGAATVNAFPFLRHLPSWFPGAGFKRYANESKDLTTAMREVPFAFTEQSVASGTALPSIVSQLLSNGEDRSFIKNIAATIYSGAADTTSSAMGTFFYAMVMHPEAQRKAQEEIDNVVGMDRLPTLDDRDSLLYVEALYREVTRWRPALPLSVAHSTTEDDTYRGYFIPKGKLRPNRSRVSMLTRIIRQSGNTKRLVRPTTKLAMAHDPEQYKDPESFSPERHFNEDGKLTEEVNAFFGFGRRCDCFPMFLSCFLTVSQRICPGRHMGSATAWLAMASVLSTFNILKKRDASGQEIIPSGEYADGMTRTDIVSSHLLPYECSIAPRSEESIRLIIDGTGH